MEKTRKTHRAFLLSRFKSDTGVFHKLLQNVYIAILNVKIVDLFFFNYSGRRPSLERKYKYLHCFFHDKLEYASDKHGFVVINQRFSVEKTI